MESICWSYGIPCQQTSRHWNSPDVWKQRYASREASITIGNRAFISVNILNALRYWWRTSSWTTRKMWIFCFRSRKTVCVTDIMVAGIENHIIHFLHITPPDRTNISPPFTTSPKVWRKQVLCQWVCHLSLVGLCRGVQGSILYFPFISFYSIMLHDKHHH